MKDLTTGQLSKALNVAPRTVCKWHDEHGLKGYRLPGAKGDRRFRLPDVLEFLAAHGIPCGGLELRVVAVSDDEAFVQSVRRELAYCTVVVGADDVATGIALGEGDARKVLLVDRMAQAARPVLTSIQQHVRSGRKPVPIVFVSDEAVSADLSQEFGIDAVVPRLFEPGKLGKTVEQLARAA